MVNLRVKLKPGDVNDLANSMHGALAENLQEVTYLDFYNVSHLVTKLKNKHYTLHTFDPFKPHKVVTLKININEAHSYRNLMLKQSLIWENDYLTNLHHQLLNELDRQLKNVEKFI